MTVDDERLFQEVCANKGHTATSSVELAVWIWAKEFIPNFWKYLRFLQLQRLNSSNRHTFILKGQSPLLQSIIQRKFITSVHKLDVSLEPVSKREIEFMSRRPKQKLMRTHCQELTHEYYTNSKSTEVMDAFLTGTPMVNVRVLTVDSMRAEAIMRSLPQDSDGLLVQ